MLKFNQQSFIKGHLLLSFLLIGLVVSSQQEISIMSYNLLNFSSNGSSEKIDGAATVIDFAKPDILVVQELAGDDPHLVLYNKMNQSEYGVGDFIKGLNTNKAIYYNKAKFTYISNTPISTELRDINEFKLLSIYSGDTIRVYGVHLRASSGEEDEKSRHDEVKILRKVTDELPDGSVFFVCGDFNIYQSYEAAYQELLNKNTPGYFIDPIYMPGSFNQERFAAYHTQSTRVDGVGGGGMDDRFDMIFHSEAVEFGLKASYLSTEVLGNDGLHFDRAVNDLPNNSAPSNVIQALFDASDHLPVLGKYLLKRPSDITPADTAKVVSKVDSAILNGNEIIITEFASEGTAEWVEIYNASETELKLSEYNITQYSTTGPEFSDKYNLDASFSGKTLAPGEYALVIDDGDAESVFKSRWPDFPFNKAIVIPSFALFNGTTGDEIIITKVFDDAIIDMVNWLNPNELLEFTDGKKPSSSSSETANRINFTGNSDDVSNWTLSLNGSPGKPNFEVTSLADDLIKKSVNFSIYPNPSNGVFNLDVKSTKTYLVSVYNSVGELLFSKNNLNTIDLSYYSEGLYYIRVNNNSIKVIKQ